MAPPPRPTDFDARYLRRLVGTQVTTFDDIGPPKEQPAVSPSASGISHTTAPATTASPTTAPSLSSHGSPPSLSSPDSPPSGTCRSWIITEKLYEKAVWRTQEEVDSGFGTPVAIGTFLCHLEEDPDQEAFMRIYYQIPITGTADADLATLAQQIRPPGVCGEREAFRLLMNQGCSAVPRFLGSAESKQGENHDVPGGWIKYLVWEKIPGESLTEEFFWSLKPSERDDIRKKFRAAYEEILRCGVVPEIPRISKIIYDQPTGNVHLSGFRGGWPIRDKFQWADTVFLAYRLAKRPEGSLNWRCPQGDWVL